MKKVCNGYVTEPANDKQLPQKILFDWESTAASKIVVSCLLSVVCLFDGCLTEIKSYPQLLIFSLLGFLFSKNNI